MDSSARSGRNVNVINTIWPHNIKNIRQITTKLQQATFYEKLQHRENVQNADMIAEDSINSTIISLCTRIVNR